MPAFQEHVAPLAPGRSRPPRTAARCASAPTGAARSPTPTRDRGSRVRAVAAAPAGAGRARPPVPARLRPGHVAAVRTVAGVRRAAGRRACSTRSAGELEPVVVEGERRPGSLAGDTAADEPAAGRAAAAVLRRLRGRLPPAAAASSPAGPPSGRSPAARPAPCRCCWSTAWSPACGTSAAPAGGSRVTVEPFGRLTVRHRELDDQVARVGEILEATPELTIGEARHL